jgi:hypothetical protein
MSTVLVTRGLGVWREPRLATAEGLVTFGIVPSSAR